MFHLIGWALVGAGVALAWKELQGEKELSPDTSGVIVDVPLLEPEGEEEEEIEPEEPKEEVVDDDDDNNNDIGDVSPEEEPEIPGESAEGDTEVQEPVLDGSGLDVDGEDGVDENTEEGNAPETEEETVEELPVKRGPGRPRKQKVA